jgi:thymidylate synthase (FAD)
MGDDLDVVNAAKVSFAKESKEFDDNSVRLIKYLAKHKHMSPFGHCFARFHVKAPIFVARQLVKHKFLRWNEVSRRYVDDEPEFYVPDVWRGRSADKKQGSDGVVKLEGVDGQIVDDYAAEALTAYQALLEAGVAPEQSRMVLPQSTMTEWWWSGSLDAFADMCNLRRKEDTQYETRLVANSISIRYEKVIPYKLGGISYDTTTNTIVLLNNLKQVLVIP